MTKSQPTKWTSDILEYRNTHTARETAAHFHLSQERIRQIGLKKFQKKCSIHKRLYFNKCSYCINEKWYSDLLSKFNFDEIMDEIEYQAINRSRDYLSTMRRVMLIKILKNTYGKSISYIARVFNRNHSTIIHLLKQYGQK